MKQFKTTEISAAASGCASINKSSFAPIYRSEIIRAARSARRHIGLTRTDLAVLDALISYLPLKAKDGSEIPARMGMMLTVFASNSSICARVGDLDERCLRRAVANLGKLGLLHRHDSATGKRYARRINGQIVEAYGFDLQPLFQKGAEIRLLATTLQQEEANRRSIRSEAVNIRAKLIHSKADLNQDDQNFLLDVEKVLRRSSLTLRDITTLRDRLLAMTTNILSQKSHINEDLPQEESAANGQFVRHIESKKIKLKKEKRTRSNDTDDANLISILHRSREIQKYLTEEPKSLISLKAMITTIMSWIGCDSRTITQTTDNLGWARTLQTLDFILPKIEKIKNVGAYFRAITLPAGKSDKSYGKHPHYKEV